MTDSLFDRIDREEALRAVLDHLGVNYRPGHYGWQKVSCPNGDAHAGGDKNPSCSVNLSIGRVKCHSCGLRGDWAGVMYEIEGMTVDQVVKQLHLEEGENRGNTTTTTTTTGTIGGEFIF